MKAQWETVTEVSLGLPDFILKFGSSFFVARLQHVI
jgi:hypothetical protein